MIDAFVNDSLQELTQRVRTKVSECHDLWVSDEERAEQSRAPRPDEATDSAITAYLATRERAMAAEERVRLGELAHELRNLLSTAMLSFDAIRAGATPGGRIGAMHLRSLEGLRDLIDISLMEVRLDTKPIRRERVIVADFLADERLAAALKAEARGLRFSVFPANCDAMIEVDRRVVGGALANLLQNALKFTREGSHVALKVRASEARVSIDVEDECGGLQQGQVEELFRPFEQRNLNRTGLGLGLSIARRAVEANGGELLVQDLPEIGCRFTIDLPRCGANQNVAAAL